MRTVSWVAWFTLAAGCAWGQKVDGPSFEVASIKPAEPLPAKMTVGTRLGCGGGPRTTDPGLWKCTYVGLADLIITAYDLDRYQFTPADWMLRTRFDVAAKVPPGATQEQFRRMQQNLLAERFKLAVHHEPKEMTMYQLTVGKTGPKVKETAADAVLTEPEAGAVPHFTMGKDGFPSFPAGQAGMIGLNGRFRWTESNVTAADMAKKLSGVLAAPVVDATGLKGKYDVDLYWQQPSMGGGRGLASAATPEGTAAAEPDENPTIQSALQNKLGLKLESKKGPVDIVVVDHAEKVPSEN
jgi:uncharacterized protein (TIGR03435 family)